VKIDMAKAYDKVEWVYICDIIIKLGFRESLVNMIMNFVETVRFSVRVNRHLSNDLSPSSGIRQGDPMSPFLGPNFLAKGVRVGIHAPWVSHLLFVNDCMVFMQASERGGAC
jgi:hypothetical protein